MSDHTGIAIVWPAYFEGSTDPEAHVTALFLGNTDTATFTKEDVWEALGTDFCWGNIGLVYSDGTALFGKDGDVPVVLLQGGMLGPHYQTFTRRLNNAGIPYSDLFPFNPHVTVPERSVIPQTVHLAGPTLWWGNERVLHPEHARRQKAVDAALDAVLVEHGYEIYRDIMATGVHAALKALA